MMSKKRFKNVDDNFSFSSLDACGLLRMSSGPVYGRLTMLLRGVGLRLM
jgi:hypothetical protein